MAMIELPPLDLDEWLRQVNQDARGVTIPRNFNPLTATELQLAENDLPQRPDPGKDPDLHQFWTDMFTPPLVFHEGDLSYSSGSNQGAGGAVALPFRRQSSLNWSGASITPRDGLMFTDVLATWLVPAVSVPLNGDPYIEYKSSCWAVSTDNGRTPIPPYHRSARSKASTRMAS
jgi:hypothetical protein